MESNEQNKLVNKIETETQVHQTDRQLLERKCRNWMKEGERISQRTYMHDPWTGATIWGLPDREEGVLSGCGRCEKSGDKFNSTNNKIQ